MSSPGQFPPADWRSHQHRFWAAPQSAAPSTEVLVLPLHGTGGDENSLVDLARALVPGCAILSPRGRVLEGGQWPRFFRRFSEGSYDFPDLVQRAAELVEWIVAARNHYGVPSQLPCLSVGYSNGANMAAALCLLHPGIIDSALLLRPALQIPEEYLPAPSAGSGRIWMSVGERDPICPPSGARQLQAQLTSQGFYGCELDIQPGSGHDLTSRDVDRARDVLQSWAV